MPATKVTPTVDDDGEVPIPPEATEEQPIALWLHGKSPNTIRAYRRDLSHGTRALRRGADLATERETLGHASLTTTGRYLHASPEKSSGDYLAI